jgi:putative endonuclease
MPGVLRVVYIIRSRSDPSRYYAGLTTDVSARITAHNAGRCRHTRRFTPCELVVAIDFSEAQRAIAFEQYLKSGSGVAFSRRHLR